MAGFSPQWELARAGGAAAIRPPIMPQAHATGPNPYRLLLIGPDTLLGHGVEPHELGPVDRLARSIAARTGHGASIDLLTLPAPTARIFEDRTLQHLDGLVLVLDAPRSVRDASALSAQVRGLLIEAATRMPPLSPMTLVLASPSTRTAGGSRRDHRRSELAAAVADSLLPLASTLVLPARADGEPIDPDRPWARGIAEHLAPRLREPNRWRAPFDRLDEPSRLDAVDRLSDIREHWATEVAPLVTAAARAYGTRYAALEWIGEDEVEALACQGFAPSSWSRGALGAPLVLRAHAGILVGDATEDPRFSSCPPVQEGRVGFSAGYRIESPDRQPVAALAVFDPEPRIVADRDITVLRDLALTAQRRLWDLSAAAPTGRRRTPARRAGQEVKPAAPSPSPGPASGAPAAHRLLDVPTPAASR